MSAQSMELTPVAEHGAVQQPARTARTDPAALAPVAATEGAAPPLPPASHALAPSTPEPPRPPEDSTHGASAPDPRAAAAPSVPSGERKDSAGAGAGAAAASAGAGVSGKSGSRARERFKGNSLRSVPSAAPVAPDADAVVSALPEIHVLTQILRVACILVLGIAVIGAVSLVAFNSSVSDGYTSVALVSAGEAADGVEGMLADTAAAAKHAATLVAQSATVLGGASGVHANSTGVLLLRQALANAPSHVVRLFVAEQRESGAGSVYGVTRSEELLSTSAGCLAGRPFGASEVAWEDCSFGALDSHTWYARATASPSATVFGDAFHASTAQPQVLPDVTASLAVVSGSGEVLAVVGASFNTTAIGEYLIASQALPLNISGSVAAVLTDSGALLGTSLALSQPPAPGAVHVTSSAVAAPSASLASGAADVADLLQSSDGTPTLSAALGVSSSWASSTTLVAAGDGVLAVLVRLRVSLHTGAFARQSGPAASHAVPPWCALVVVPRAEYVPSRWWAFSASAITVAIVVLVLGSAAAYLVCRGRRALAKQGLRPTLSASVLLPSSPRISQRDVRGASASHASLPAAGSGARADARAVPPSVASSERTLGGGAKHGPRARPAPEARSRGWLARRAGGGTTKFMLVAFSFLVVAVVYQFWNQGTNTTDDLGGIVDKLVAQTNQRTGAAVRQAVSGVQRLPPLMARDLAAQTAAGTFVVDTSMNASFAPATVSVASPAAVPVEEYLLRLLVWAREAGIPVSSVMVGWGGSGATAQAHVDSGAGKAWAVLRSPRHQSSAVMRQANRSTYAWSAAGARGGGVNMGATHAVSARWTNTAPAQLTNAQWYTTCASLTGDTGSVAWSPVYETVSDAGDATLSFVVAARLAGDATAYGGDGCAAAVLEVSALSSLLTSKVVTHANDKSDSHGGTADESMFLSVFERAPPHHLVAASSPATQRGIVVTSSNGALVRATTASSGDESTALVGAVASNVTQADGVTGVAGIGTGQVWYNLLPFTHSAGVSWVVATAVPAALSTVITDGRGWQVVAFMIGVGITAMTTLVAVAAFKTALPEPGHHSTALAPGAAAPAGDGTAAPDGETAPAAQGKSKAAASGVAAAMRFVFSLRKAQRDPDLSALAHPTPGIDDVRKALARLRRFLRIGEGEQVRDVEGSSRLLAKAGVGSIRVSHKLWEAACRVTEAPMPNPAARWKLLRLQRMNVIRSVVLRALKRDNVVHKVFMALQDRQYYALRVFMHDLLHRKSLRAVVLGAPFVHMSASFVEAGFTDTLRDSTTTRTVLLGVEGALLFVYWLSVVSYFFVHRLLVRDRAADLQAVRLFMGERRKRVLWGVARLVLVVVMTLDFVVRLAIHDYRTGPDGQFMLPYSCLLRPALVVVQSAALRNVIAHFALTLAKSRDVFVLALSFMVVGAIGSMLLLQGRLEDQHEFGRGFDDFRWSFLTIFIFTASGENYTEVVYPAAAFSEWFRLYFAVLSAAGLFLLISLLIGFFQRHYSAEYDAREEKLGNTALVRQRSGLLLAFSLLQDVNAQEMAYEAHFADVMMPATAGVESPDSASGAAGANASGAHSRSASSPPAVDFQRRLSVASETFHKDAMQAVLKRPRTVRLRNVAKLTLEYRNVVGLNQVSDTTYSSFFELLGVAPSALKDLSASELSRFRTFRYDTQQFASSLQKRLRDNPAAGCDPLFVSGVQDFLSRCSLMYATARKTGNVAYDVAQFVLQCEALDDAGTRTDGASENPMMAYYQDMRRSGASADGQGGGAEGGTGAPDAVPGMPPLSAQRSFTAQDFARVQRDMTTARSLHPSTAASTDAGASRSSVGRASVQGERESGPAGPHHSVLGQDPRALHHRRSSQGGSEAAALARVIMSTSLNRRSKQLTRFRRFQLAMRTFFDNQWAVPYHSLVLVVIIANVIVIALSSTPHTENVVPYLALFLLFYVAELSLRVLAEDVPSDFWSFNRLQREQPDLPHRAMALRFDIVVVVATVVAFVATRVASGTVLLTVSDEYRIVYMIPLLRLFSIVQTTRAIVFGVVFSLHSVLPLLALLVIVEYVFACAGVWLFAGLLSQLPTSTYELSEAANFDTFSLALTTLVQLFTGEGWHEIMFAAVDATASLSPCVYFIMHHSVVLLLCANLFIGIVCDRVQDAAEETRKAAELTRKRAAVKQAIHVKRLCKLLEGAVRARRLRKQLRERRMERGGTAAAAAPTHAPTSSTQPPGGRGRGVHAPAESKPGAASFDNTGSMSGAAKPSRADRGSDGGVRRTDSADSLDSDDVKLEPSSSASAMAAGTPNDAPLTPSQRTSGVQWLGEELT